MRRLNRVSVSEAMKRRVSRDSRVGFEIGCETVENPYFVLQWIMA